MEEPVEAVIKYLIDKVVALTTENAELEAKLERAHDEYKREIR